MSKSTPGLLGLLAAFALAAPALAEPASAPSANPPMADGDMGCFIALGIVAMDAENASKSDKLEQKDRDTMASLSIMMDKDAQWFFGRVSLMPPAQRTHDVFRAAFERVDKTDKKQTFSNAMACSKWAKDTNTAILDTWSGK